VLIVSAEAGTDMQNAPAGHLSGKPDGAAAGMTCRCLSEIPLNAARFAEWRWVRRRAGAPKYKVDA